MNGDLYAYEFKSPVNDIINYPSLQKCPKFCVVRNKDIKEMYVNYFHNLTETIQIKITSIAIKVSFDIRSSILVSPKNSLIGPLAAMAQICQFTEDNYFFAESYDSFFPVYYGKYEEGMTIKDLQTLNSKYFNPIDKKIYRLEKNIIHIIVVQPVFNHYNSKVYI